MRETVSYMLPCPPCDMPEEVRAVPQLARHWWAVPGNWVVSGEWPWDYLQTKGVRIPHDLWDKLFKYEDWPERWHTADEWLACQESADYDCPAGKRQAALQAEAESYYLSNTCSN